MSHLEFVRPTVKLNLKHQWKSQIDAIIII